MPIRDVRVRAGFDLVATPLMFFLRPIATCLGNFVVSAALCSRQIRSLPIVASFSRGLELSTLFLVRDEGRVGSQCQSIQSSFI
jgi:hypothetical protein